MKTEMDRDDEKYSEWSANDYVFEIVSIGGAISRGASVVFITWSIISFIHAEIEWQAVTQKDGMIGVGTTAYALVLYARPIALACISAALAIISHSNLTKKMFRVSRRDVFAVPPEERQHAVAPPDDSDLIGNRLLEKLKAK